MAKKTPTAEVPNPFGELSRTIEQFKLPGVDMAAIAESRRKDVDALMAANQSALDAVQELARRQAELFTQAMRSAQDTLVAMAGSGSAPDPAKQNELARQAYEQAVAQMSELAELARKAQAESMAAITRRAQESVLEIKQALAPK